MNKIYYHLPGLFEFHELYKVFLPLFYNHKEYFYDWCEIGSIYGSPQGSIWSGGRTSSGTANPLEVLKLTNLYHIDARLTFSNLLLENKHLSDPYCNQLCQLFHNNHNGIIIASNTLLEYLKTNYPNFYFVSSTTKVLTHYNDFYNELMNDDYKYVVPDFRLNKSIKQLKTLPQQYKDKVEFLCNECCFYGCNQRKECYENVSRLNLGSSIQEHQCLAPNSKEGYRFSKAMTNPGFISIEDIQNIYMPLGFTNFKIEGRGLGSAIVLEFLLYYMVKPEYQLIIREEIYLDSMLDLF